MKRIPPSASEQTEIMPQDIRAIVPGGTFFFTVTLLERRRKFLTEHIDDLRAVFKAARERRPFAVEGIVICPITCIASGRCLPGMQISPCDGMISKRDLQHKFPEGRDFQRGA